MSTDESTREKVVEALWLARDYVTDAIATERQQMAGYEHLSDLIQMCKDLSVVDEALDLLGEFVDG